MVKETVRNVVKKYGTNNPFEIARSINIILIYANLNGIRGFYQYFKRNNIIYIDEKLSDHDKKFVCAHELGHIFLHKKMNKIFMDANTNFNTEKFEVEANKFAVELLIDNNELFEYREYSINQIARIFGYSEKVIELKLK